LWENFDYYRAWEGLNWVVLKVHILTVAVTVAISVAASSAIAAIAALG